MEKRDYYEVLGVSRDADATACKRAYRKLAMQYHPDRNPDSRDAEEKFKEASEAYSVLSDPEKRARYDQFGHAGLAGNGGFNGSDLQDIFSEFFGDLGDIFGTGSRRGSRARRGDDLQYELEISFEDAVFGASKEIRLPRTEACDRCDGSGCEPGSRRGHCGNCGGRGQVVTQQGFFTDGPHLFAVRRNRAGDPATVPSLSRSRRAADAEQSHDPYSGRGRQRARR